MDVESYGAIYLDLKNMPFRSEESVYIIAKSYEDLFKAKIPGHGPVIRTDCDLEAVIQKSSPVVLTDSGVRALQGNPHIVVSWKQKQEYLSDRRYAKFTKEVLKSLDEKKLSLTKKRRDMYIPLGDENCIPEASSLLPISKNRAENLNLIYYFTGSACAKGHIDTTVIKRYLPEFLPKSKDMCRTCAEDRIKEICPWRTNTHWRTQPATIRRYVWLKSGGSEAHLLANDIGYGYLYPEHYPKTSRFPFPDEIHFISKDRARTLGLPYYFPDSPCPRNHIDLRYINSDECVHCVEELKKVLAGKKYNPAYRTKDPCSSAPNCTKLPVLQLREDEYINVVRGQKATIGEIRKYLAMCIYGFRRRIHWTDFDFKGILGYEPKQLKMHLHSRLSGELTPENIGTMWSVDHIIPVKFLFDHDLLYPNIVNNLFNLQPLEAKANSAKHMYMVREDVIAFREKLLLPNGLDFKPGWERDRRIIERPFWLS